MADLIARILLKDEQFNETIEKSKRQVTSFNQGMDVVKGGMMKFAGILGVATTAGAAFNKIMDNSGALSATFNKSLASAQMTVDEFFRSLGTGDFSSFLNGLNDVYNKAWATKSALGDLAKVGLSFGVESTKLAAEISEVQAEAYDTELSAEERLGALDRWKPIIDRYRSIAENKQKSTFKALASEVTLSNALKPEDLTVEVVEKVIFVQNEEDRKGALAKAKEQYKTYQEELKKIAKEHTVYDTLGATGALSAPKLIVSEEGKRLQAEAAGRNKEAILMVSYWEKLNKKKREEISGLAGDFYGLSRSISDYEKTANKTIPRLEKKIGGEQEDKKTKKGKTDEIIPAGSLAEIENQLKEARKAFANATTEEARAAADKLIKSLERQKVQLEVQFKINDPGNIAAKQAINKYWQSLDKTFKNTNPYSGSIAPVKTSGKWDALQEVARLNTELTKAETKLKNAFDAESIRKASAEVKKIKDDIEVINKAHGIDVSKIKLPDIKKGKEIKTYSDVLYDITEKNRDSIDSFNAVSSAINNIGGALDNEAGAWLQWGANVVGAIGQAIPAIAALTAAKTAETTANTASAASGAASSVASIPLVGPILAVAAVASIIAALANIPKFAYGGIVPGNSFSGDKLLAGVNSGEMILNSAQQSNLFNLLNGGASSPGGTNKIELELSGKTARAIIEADKLWRSRM